MTDKEIKEISEEFDKKFFVKSAFGQCINDQDGNANERIKQFICEKLAKRDEKLLEKIGEIDLPTDDYLEKQENGFFIARHLRESIKDIKKLLI